MTAAQLMARVKKSRPPPAVLLLGPEAYQRRRIKQALTAAFPEGAVSQLDLSEVSLAAVLDDARALSLFASDRLIWVVSAEAVLPGKMSSDEDEGDPAPPAMPRPSPLIWRIPRPASAWSSKPPLRF